MRVSTTWTMLSTDDRWRSQKPIPEELSACGSERVNTATRCRVRSTAPAKVRERRELKDCMVFAKVTSLCCGTGHQPARPPTDSAAIANVAPVNMAESTRPTAPAVRRGRGGGRAAGAAIWLVSSFRGR